MAVQVAAFRRVGTLELDERRRVSLGRIGRRQDRSYLVEESDDGEIRLIPAVTISEREALLLASPERIESIKRGIAEAKAGDSEVHSFADCLDDED
jgi:hypothetical protein